MYVFPPFFWPLETWPQNISRDTSYMRAYSCHRSSWLLSWRVSYNLRTTELANLHSLARNVSMHPHTPLTSSVRGSREKQMWRKRSCMHGSVTWTIWWSPTETAGPKKDPKTGGADRVDRSITPAEEHDKAAADDVELGPLLPERLVQLLHLGSNLHCSWG